MSALTAAPVPVDVLAGPRAPSAAGAHTAAAIRKTAEDFEAAFLSSMLQPIFNQLPTDGMFGGGQGEATFRSFMVDAMSRQMVRSGGIGLADTVQRQMLQMQGLTETPAPGATQTAPAAPEAQAGAAPLREAD
ncbi:MAG: rod-binding protein [Caulobacteraceae bacterium]|nr:rod-binding protein [Caulobacteraceae bacterium]